MATVKLSVYLNPVFDDPSFVDRVHRAADLGADAVEVGAWDVDDLEPLAAAARERDLGFAYVSGLVGDPNDPAAVDERVAEAEAAVERAAALGCEHCNVSPGAALDGHDRDAQFDATVEVLRRAAPAAASVGVTLLVEPLNRAVDHPGTLLTSTARAVDLVERADSPAVGVLFDVYHAQVAGGDVTRTLVGALDSVAHVHVADNPGRGEPGTGELDYEHVLGALADAGYDGYVGCEFTPSGDPGAAIERVRGMLQPDG